MIKASIEGTLKILIFLMKGQSNWSLAKKNIEPWDASKIN
jgi:hypothetical protein